MFHVFRRVRAAKGRAGVVALLSAAAMALPGVPAQAATSGADSSAGAAPSYQSVCGAPKPGTFSC